MQPGLGGPRAARRRARRPQRRRLPRPPRLQQETQRRTLKNTLRNHNRQAVQTRGVPSAAPAEAAAARRPCVRRTGNSTAADPRRHLPPPPPSFSAGESNHPRTPPRRCFPSGETKQRGVRITTRKRMGAKQRVQVRDFWCGIEEQMYPSVSAPRLGLEAEGRGRGAREHNAEELRGEWSGCGEVVRFRHSFRLLCVPFIC